MHAKGELGGPILNQFKNDLLWRMEYLEFIVPIGLPQVYLFVARRTANRFFRVDKGGLLCARVIASPEVVKVHDDGVRLAQCL